jgi:ribonuclease BN (tRNA processing enzyme)
MPLYAPTGALDAVLALDKPGMLAPAYTRRDFAPGDALTVGPFTIGTAPLPHHVPNAGLRLTTADGVMTYTGDTGPSPEITRLAEGADVLLSEATYPHEVPDEDAPYLLTAVLAGQYAARAGVARLLLTHLWPGTDPATAVKAAAGVYDGPVDVATTGLVVEI